MSFIYTNSTVSAAASFGGWAKWKGNEYNVHLWNSKGLTSTTKDSFESNVGNYSDSGLWITRFSMGTNFWVNSCIAFDISDLPPGATIVSADLGLTVAGSSGGVATTVVIYELLRDITSSATFLTYDGTNSWRMPGLMPGQDCGSEIMSSTIVSSSAYAGLKINFDVTALAINAFNREDKKIRMLLKVNDVDIASYRSSKSILRFYTGYQSSKWIPSWGGSGEWVYPNYGNNGTDKPTLTIQYNTPISVLTSDGGSLTQASEVVSTGDGYHTIGYYIAGAFGDDQKYFVRNNSEATVNDVCIWTDWARATIPIKSGAGTASISYITCQDGEGGKGAPSSQLWRATCITGGSSSQWSIEMDNGTFASTGTSTWSNASPSILSCTATTGAYVSTANTQGISFTITATAPQINDRFTWQTYASTVVPDVRAISKSMIKIAPDSSGTPGTYKNLQPLRTTITQSAITGATQLVVLDTSNFAQNDNIVIYNLSNNAKVYNTISSIVTGGVINLTGGVSWAVSPGFQIYHSPLSVGTLNPITWYDDQYYEPFWLAIDTPGGTDTGIYAVRLQVTEGP